MSPRKLLVIRPSPTSTPDVAHAYVQGDTIYDGRDAFAPPQGTGQGAAVTNLFITPRHYGQHSDVQVTMLHELVHVVRSMTGQRAYSPTLISAGTRAFAALCCGRGTWRAYAGIPSQQPGSVSGSGGSPKGSFQSDAGLIGLRLVLHGLPSVGVAFAQSLCAGPERIW
jgi:hypothetical protein